MNTFQRIMATAFAGIAGLATLGAGALFVAMAIVIGGLLAIAARFAISASTVRPTPRQDDDDLGFTEDVTA